jgi:hypothetical protein
MPYCFRSTRTYHSAECAPPRAQDTLESQLKSRPAPEELIRGGILNGARDTVVLRTCALADELRAPTARTPCRGRGPDVARLKPLRSILVLPSSAVMMVLLHSVIVLAFSIAPRPPLPLCCPISAVVLLERP